MPAVGQLARSDVSSMRCSRELKRLWQLVSGLPRTRRLSRGYLQPSPSFLCGWKSHFPPAQLRSPQRIEVADHALLSMNSCAASRCTCSKPVKLPEVSYSSPTCSLCGGRHPVRLYLTQFRNGSIFRGSSLPNPSPSLVEGRGLKPSSESGWLVPPQCRLPETEVGERRFVTGRGALIPEL